MTSGAAGARPPTLPEQARSVERRARVLTAALKLLQSSGSAAVTHRRVADESGSSPGAVRYYFRTRADLLAACLDHLESTRHAEAELLLQRLPVTRRSPAQTARRAMEVYCGAELDDTTVFGAVWCMVDCSRESPRLAALMGAHRKASEAHLAQLLARCGYSNVAPSLVTAVIDGSTMSAALEGRTGAADLAMAELAEVLRLASRD